MRCLSAIFLLPLLLASCLLPSLAQESPLPRANEVVQARAYVSLKPVPRGRTFELGVVAHTRPGFHINAHEVSEDYLIPTTLEAELPQGLRRLGITYPPGVLRKFSFSPAKLLVYEGSVTLRMKLQAAPDALLGPRRLPLTLRYQACNQEACLPPVKIPITAELEIAPAGALARPAHPAIFAATQQSKTPSPQ